MSFIAVSPFEDPTVKLAPKAQVVFVSDMFVQDYVGGAELTTEALIKSAPYEIARIRSKQLTPQVIQDNRDSL